MEEQTKEFDKKEFDVQIMLESFEKAEKVLEARKEKLKNTEVLKDLAITFFNSSMTNIRESKKLKNRDSMY
jgi:hypothetical protein